MWGGRKGHGTCSGLGPQGALPAPQQELLRLHPSPNVLQGRFCYTNSSGPHRSSRMQCPWAPSTPGTLTPLPTPQEAWEASPPLLAPCRALTCRALSPLPELQALAGHQAEAPCAV